MKRLKGISFNIDLGKESRSNLMKETKDSNKRDSVLVQIRRKNRGNSKANTCENEKRQALLLKIECFMFSDNTLLERNIAEHKDIFQSTNKYKTTITPMNHIFNCRDRIHEPKSRFIIQVYLKDENTKSSTIAFSKQFVVRQFISLNRAATSPCCASRLPNVPSSRTRKVVAGKVRYQLFERDPSQLPTDLDRENIE